MLKTISRLPRLFTNSSARFRLGYKALVLVILLLCVFISSGIFISSVYAPAGVSLIPSAGYCNPLANSGLIPFASGHDEFYGWAGVWGCVNHGVRDSAVYGGNGYEAIAVAEAYASAEGTSDNWNLDVQGTATITWPYIIMKNGVPLDDTSETGPIPLQLSYDMSLLLEGDDARAQGWVIVEQDSSARVMMGLGIGQYSGIWSNNPPAHGQISFTRSFESRSANYLTVTDIVLAGPSAFPHVEVGKMYASSEVEGVVHSFLRIDPSSPLASQLQVYAGINYTADPNNASQWTPMVQTPLDLGSIIPVTTGTEALAVRGMDNRIYYRSQNGTTWQNWNVLPGSTIDSPASATLTNHLHIVVRGADGSSLWCGYLTNISDPATFSQWTRLDGATSSAPALTSNSTALCLSVRGLDNRIYFRCYNGSWQPWHAVPTGATLDSPAASMHGNDLHIVVRGMDGTSLWDIIMDCNGTVVRDWKRLSGATALKPALTSLQGSNYSYLAVTGLDNRIYYMNYSSSTDSWGSWKAIATGATIDGPAVTAIAGNLYVVVRGTHGNSLWYGSIDWGTNSFSSWTLLSGATLSAPTLAS